MTHSAALRKARSLYRLAETSPLASERAAAADRLKALCARYNIHPADLHLGETQVIIVPVGTWRDEETDLISVVMQIAGAQLVRKPSGDAYLISPAIAMPRMYELVQRLIGIYRRESVRLDKAMTEWRSFLFTSFYAAFAGVGPDKASFLGGLTLRLIERLLPPPPPPNHTCTALVRTFQPVETPAPPAFATRRPTSAIDFAQGVACADTIELSQTRAQLVEKEPHAETSFEDGPAPPDRST